MKKLGFSQRIVVPTAIVLVTMVLSRIVYFNSSATVATLSGVVMFLIILVFAGMYVYQIFKEE